MSLDEARAVTEAWGDDDDGVRPHGALGNRTPSELARPVDGHAHLPALHGSQTGWYQVGGSVTPRSRFKPDPSAVLFDRRAPHFSTGVHTGDSCLEVHDSGRGFRLEPAARS